MSDTEKVVLCLILFLFFVWNIILQWRLSYCVEVANATLAVNEEIKEEYDIMLERYILRHMKPR